MLARVYRYDKPSRNVFLDILNYSNNTAFELAQLDIGLPVAVDHTLTSVLVKPSDNVSWTQEVPLRYHRLDLRQTFGRIPLVIDAPDNEPSTILLALREQYGLYFDADQISLVQAERKLDSAVVSEQLTAFGSADVTEVVIPGEPDPRSTGEDDFTITALPTNLIWVGAVDVLVRRTFPLLNRNIRTGLAVRQYFHDTRQHKVPVELIVEKTADATAHSAKIKLLKKDSFLQGTSKFNEVAKALTGDDWVIQTQAADFNLMGAKVIHNGFNVGEFYTGFARFSHVLVLELGELCNNLSGFWAIQYNDAESYKYTDFRVDRGPLLDM